MKNSMIVTATLALVLGFVFAATASAAPYVKGNATQIQNEVSVIPSAPAHDAASNGGALKARVSLGVENGNGAVAVSAERGNAHTETAGAGQSTGRTAKADRPNYGVENGDGAGR